MWLKQTCVSLPAFYIRYRPHISAANSAWLFRRSAVKMADSTPPAKGKRRKAKSSEAPSPSPHRSKKADVEYPITALVAKSLLHDLAWESLALPDQVNFNYTLQCGQSFAWQQIHESLYCGTVRRAHVPAMTWFGFVCGNPLHSYHGCICRWMACLTCAIKV
jgi:hypothetical protein